MSKEQNKIIIETILIAKNQPFSGYATLNFEVPNKEGYSAFVLRPYANGSWSDKFALVGMWDGVHRFSIRNVSETDFTWNIFCAVMYISI